MQKEGVVHVLDVGANIGQFSICLLYFNPESNVILVEPNNLIIPLLEKNLNQYSHRWELIRAAVGPVEKHSEFYFVLGKSSQGSLIEMNASHNLLGDNSVDTVRVKERPLTAEYIQEETGQNINYFDLIKVDVEGYEKNALEGLKSLRTSYCWLETIKNRGGGIDFIEARKIVENSFGEVVLSIQKETNSLFGF